MWVYAYEKPLERLDNLVDAELRPLLQQESIDTASKKRDGIANTVMNAIEHEMIKFGAYSPSSGKRLVIEDINLPNEVIQLRELKLKGEKEAQEATARASGYWKPIKEISNQLDISVDEARKIYETQRGLETLQEVKPSMNLVGENFKGVIGTMNLGK